MSTVLETSTITKSELATLFTAASDLLRLVEIKTEQPSDHCEWFYQFEQQPLLTLSKMTERTRVLTASL